MFIIIKVNGLNPGGSVHVGNLFFNAEDDRRLGQRNVSHQLSFSRLH